VTGQEVQTAVKGFNELSAIVITKCQLLVDPALTN